MAAESGGSRKPRVVCDARFGASDAAGVVFEDGQFEDCTFERCDFQGRELRRAKFVDSVFEGSDLVVMKVPDATFARVDFRNCRLSGVNWSVARKIEQVTFTACQLSDCSFLGLRLDECAFTDCVARNTQFRDSSLRKATFGGTNLAMAEFTNCDLREADFRGATDYLIDATQNRLQKARFSLPEAVTLLRGLGIRLD